MFQKIAAFFMAIIAFFANLFNPSKPSDKFDSYTNISYGTHERQVLDLYIPQDAEGSLGLVLCIHGGAWIFGDKGDYSAKTLQNFSKTYGCAAATINYRYISESIHIDDLLDDIGAALAKIKELGSKSGVNIDKVILTGYSAGAHLSLLYAYSKAENSAIKPVAVVSYSGPTDLSDENFYVGNDLGSPEYVSQLMSYACGKTFTPDSIDSAKDMLDKVSPVSYVKASTVPTLIAHGQKDTVVPYSNAVTLDAKLTAYGVKHDLVTYPNSNHDLGSDSKSASQMDKLVSEYVKAYLG